MIRAKSQSSSEAVSKTEKVPLRLRKQTPISLSAIFDPSENGFPLASILTQSRYMVSVVHVESYSRL